MNDERGTSWSDGPDRQRHHHPAIDRGHSIMRRGQHSDGDYQEPGYPRGEQPRGHDPRASDPRGYDPRAADPRGYPPQAPDPRYGPGDYRPAEAYPGGRGGAGYPPDEYDDQSGYVSGDSYGAYADDPYSTGQAPAPGYGRHDVPDPRMSDPRAQRPHGWDARDPHNGRAQQPGYDDYDPGYPAGGYPADGYPPEAYPPDSYPREVYPPDGYAPDGYAPDAHPPGAYPPAAQDQDYPTGSFIEQGFGDAGRQYDRADETNGRGARRVRSGNTDPRGVRSGNTDPRGLRSRQVAPQPELADDFYEPDDAPKRRKRSPVVFIVAIVMLAAIVFGGYFAFTKISGYFGTPDYSGNGSGSVKVKVADGDTATDIATTLVNAGVIKGTKAFITAATSDTKSRSIQPGTYTLHRKMSAANALQMLEATDGNNNPVNALVYKVTIPEGSISINVFAALAKATGLPVKDFQTAAKDPVALGVDKAWFVGKTHNGRPFLKSIEGFLYPATYNFQPDESAQQILKDMIAKFNEVVAPDDLNIKGAASRLGMTPYEILINASIAQAEASTAPDMAGVAEVVLNRIYRTNGDAGDRLGIDSEVNYWLKINGKASKDSSELTVSQLHDPKDPYNSHDVSGLPPGAIGNPGRDALSGAINPDTRKRGYYFWQTIGTNPKVVFAKTSGQFAAQQK